MQIVPPAPGVELLGATFTPDGTSVDYVRGAAAGGTADVWRVPFLGGPPRMIVGDVSSPISWSPDGRRMAFIRAKITPTLSFDLIVAEADGARERTLASSNPGELLGRPGRTLAPELRSSVVAERKAHCGRRCYRG